MTEIIDTDVTLIQNVVSINLSYPSVLEAWGRITEILNMFQYVDRF